MKTSLIRSARMTGVLAGLILGVLALSATAQQDTSPESWLPTLITDTPEQGFQLAITLSRTGVRMTQPDVRQLREGREEYADDADSLIAASQVIAIHFQTIAAANNYWRGED